MSYEIINHLIEYEMTLAGLYELCSRKYPDLETFWKNLSAQEVGHASTIRELLKKVDNKTVILKEKRFNIRPLEISIEHVQTVTKRVMDNELNLLGILSLAYDIEKSIIESKYYEIFEGTSRVINDVLKKVRDESRNHANTIGEMKQEVYLNPPDPFDQG